VVFERVVDVRRVSSNWPMLKKLDSSLCKGKLRLEYIIEIDYNIVKHEK
jgi:hypothetical protein